MVNAFKEDFFERVVNVKWETEPEVLWMAGSGGLFFVNGILTLNGGYIHTSDNGRRWASQFIGLHSYMDPGSGSNYADKPRGFGSIMSACWMRENLQIGAPAVWVLGGVDGKTIPGSATLCSYDGKFPASAQYMDDRHYFGLNPGFYISEPPAPPTPENPRGGTGRVGVQGIGGVVFAHFDEFTSANGALWTPSNYHPRRDDDEGGGGGTGGSGGGGPSGGSSGGVSSSPNDVAARTIFNSSGRIASGRVRRGPYAGKLLNVEISPYLSSDPPGQFGGAHGFATLSITDAETGELLGTTNCGVARTQCVNYGFYTWCVGGGSNKQDRAALISTTDDLVNWRVQQVGTSYSVNAIAVGPKYGALKPTGPSGQSGAFA